MHLCMILSHVCCKIRRERLDLRQVDVCCEIRSKRLDVRQVENHQKIKLQLEQISIKTLLTENYQTSWNFFKCQAQYTLYIGSKKEFFQIMAQQEMESFYDKNLCKI